MEQQEALRKFGQHYWVAKSQVKCFVPQDCSRFHTDLIYSLVCNLVSTDLGNEEPKIETLRYYKNLEDYTPPDRNSWCATVAI